MTIFDMFKPAYCSIYRQCYLIYFSFYTQYIVKPMYNA